MPPVQCSVSQATIGTIQRMALRIVGVPTEGREEAYEEARKHYLDAAAEIEPLNEFTRGWVETTVTAIRQLVADFDALGVGHA